MSGLVKSVALMVGLVYATYYTARLLGARPSTGGWDPDYILLGVACGGVTTLVAITRGWWDR